ncbi:AAA family ATPase [Bacillus cereus]|uniref:AAA family ATPase n=1 Tax=Bacillus cereus TaxID=1396 RepID=UPI002AC080D7|nr:AAA family ATPase [Bacillus cereus]MDZ4468033.1 AAA family ATPase [Bacillus cereus]MDZ4527772.1 AAA family ATPase [Bacillus cereus]
MISKIYVNKLFNDNTIDSSIKFENEQFILTGDNGTGKTTLLNYIYYALNANFEWFLKYQEVNISIDFSSNKRSLNRLTISKFNSRIIAIYEFKKKIVLIKVGKNPFWGGFIYDGMITSQGLHHESISQFIFDDDKELDLANNFFESIEGLVNSDVKKYDFILAIRKSLLYFPTYRRIDSDIKDYIESMINDNGIEIDDSRIKEWNVLNLEKDRRVIGVGDEDIEELYSNYSREMSQKNSEGLDLLMKKFIKIVIESLYEPNLRKPQIDFNAIQSSKHLLELSDKIGIGTEIDKDRIDKYYQETYSDMNELKEIVESINGKKISTTEIPDKLLRRMVSAFGNHNQFIVELTKLYLEHLSKQDKLLLPYNNLHDSFKEFFKGKIDIKLNSKNYTITLSKAFSQLSTGEKQLITILSYSWIALRESEFERLIIIDEPELSLHIKWQRQILKQLLKKKNTKFLVATHSPFVGNVEYSSSIFKLGDNNEY